MRFNLRWEWYIATVIIGTPWLLLYVVEPEWLARLIGIALWYFCLLVIVLRYAVGPTKNFGDPERLWPSYILKFLDLKHIHIISRSLLLITSFAIIYLSVPLYKDLLGVLYETAPIVRTDKVANKRIKTLFVTEEVILNNYPPLNNHDILSAWFFGPREIKTDKNYEFVYLPQSRKLLEVREVLSKD